MAKGGIKWLELVGVISFFVGLAVAVIMGAMGRTATSVLLVLGLIIGLLNISDKEIVPFLVACVALIVSGPALASVVSYEWLVRILVNVVILVVPAAIIGALKAIYTLAATR